MMKNRWVVLGLVAILALLGGLLVSTLYLPQDAQVRREGAEQGPPAGEQAPEPREGGRESASDGEQAMRAPPRAGLEPGRDFLVRDTVEGPGYGMYSYILFGSRPNEATRERYRRTIEAYLAFPGIRALEPFFSRDQINAIYLPVKVRPGDDRGVDSVLHEYDYSRARYLLTGVPGPNPTGPYLLSSPVPILEQDDYPEEVFWQDLSSVPPGLVRVWVRKFLTESSYEEGFRGDWKEDWTLKVRTAIAQAAEGFPEVRASLSSMASWVTTLTAAPAGNDSTG